MVVSRNTVNAVGLEADAPEGGEDEYTPLPPFHSVQLVLLLLLLRGDGAAMREVSEPPGTRTQGSAMSTALSPVFTVSAGKAPPLPAPLPPLLPVTAPVVSSVTKSPSLHHHEALTLLLVLEGGGESRAFKKDGVMAEVEKDLAPPQNPEGPLATAAAHTTLVASTMEAP